MKHPYILQYGDGKMTESEERLWEQYEIEYRDAINNLPVINASDIKLDDAWMQEDVWDEIYTKEMGK